MAVVVCLLGLQVSAQTALVERSAEKETATAKAIKESPAQLGGEFKAADVLKADMKTFGASSQEVKALERLNVEGLRECELTAKNLRAEKMASTMKAEAGSVYTAPALAPRKAGAVSPIDAYYIAKDYVHEGEEVNCVMQAVVDTEDKSIVHIHNFYGLEETVDAKVDLATGALTIMPQRIWQSTTYGDVYMFPIEIKDDGVQYFTNEPITGYMDENNVIHLGQWAAISPQGKNGNYVNSLLAIIDKGDYYPSNGSMTAVKYSSGATSNIAYPLLFEQENANELIIYNFGTTGVPVKARVDATGKVTVSAQFMITISLYGVFNCYSLTNEGAIDTNNPIVGQINADGTLTFGPWIIGAAMDPTMTALITFSSKATPERGFAFKKPEVIPLNLEGNGTVASPYLIKTPADLVALSQAAATDSFTGKNFKLANDIDMAGVKGFTPIGSPTASFNADFDGDNHVISNLEIEGLGYNFQGLFGVLYYNRTVKNIVMKDCSISGTGGYLAMVAGYAFGDIKNCHVSVNADTRGQNVGGIVGRSYGVVSDCSVSGLVAGIGYTGGVVGYSFGQIINCQSDAFVSMPAIYTEAVACVGGIVGLSQSYDTNLTGKVSKCLFTGTVDNAAGVGFVGGIGGYLYANTVDNCLNVGLVRNSYEYGVSAKVGGIGGIIRDMTMNNCENAGTVESLGAADGVGGIGGYISTGYSTIGGMFEFIHVNECLNVGQVISGARTETAGVFGTEFTVANFDEKPSDTGFTNVYTDNQATGLVDDVRGVKTATLIGSTLPKGFSSTYWEAGNGYYPTLKAFAGTPASKLASAAIVFADSETTRALRTKATLVAPEGMSWKLLNGETLTDMTAGLQISDKELKVRDAYTNDRVVAVVGEETTGRFYDINAIAAYFEGKGTAESPYLIKNKADFIKMHDAVMHYDHRGDYFKQTADVDFELGDDFSGVASGNHLLQFAGVFDGDNHLIKGLKIKSVYLDENGKTMIGTYNYGGLFHLGTETSAIRNVVIDSSCKFDFYGAAAPVIGYTAGVVENCRNYAEVNGSSAQVGGIVGYATETSSLKNCYNAGDVKSTKHVGGIAGVVAGEISLCQNDGEITASDQYAGGITGALTGNLSECVNSGTISGTDYVGGIIGYVNPLGGGGNVKNTVTSGLVLATGTIRGGVIGSSNGRAEVVENNYFDCAVNHFDGCSTISQGLNPVYTAQLVSGAALEGLDASNFSFTKNIYPSLKAYANEAVGIGRRSIYIGFEKGEKNSNIVHDTPLGSDAKIAWTLGEGVDFKVKDGKICVTIPEDKVISDTLTAVYDNLYTKVYPLKSIPIIFEGTGSVDSPFLIKTPEDMNKLSAFMKSASMDYEDFNFLLTNDIEYTEAAPFTSVAFTGSQFQGTFDGNGKKISGIAFIGETSALGKNMGLFGTVGSKGTVKNLSVEGYLRAYQYVGGVAGQLYGKIDNCKSAVQVNGKSGYLGGIVGKMFDGSKVSNCEFTDTIAAFYPTYSAINYVGGIAGTSDLGSVIEKCVNKGVIGYQTNTTGTTYVGTQYAGGIVGMNNGEVRFCHNEGVVKAKQHAGGISGRLAKTGNIFDCYNVSDINLDGGAYVGGIAAYEVGGAMISVERCYNTGNLKAKGYTAGIVGQAVSGLTLKDCYNTGKISGFASTGYAVGGVAGQVVGTAALPSVIENCWNSADIYNEANSTGGVTGKITGTVTMRDCYNTGNVTCTVAAPAKSNNGVGGVSGSTCCVAERVWNSGNVTANIGGVGGVFGTGAMPIAKVSKAVNTGNVKTTYTVQDNGYGIGGIWGGYGPVVIEDSYNYGDVEGPDWVAGINPALHSNGNGGTTVVRCYNAGKVMANDTAKYVTNTVQISKYYNKSTPIDPELMKVDSVYYDSNENGAVINDWANTAKTKVELMTAALGDNFHYRAACLPTLEFVHEVPHASHKAVHVLYSEGDTAEDVKGEMTVGMLPTVAWTSSSNLSIDEEGTVKPLALGKGWLKATAGDAELGLEKTIEVVVTKASSSGVEDLYEAREVKNRVYFTLDGLRLDKAPTAGICIVVTEYADGTKDTKRVLIVE